jgi:hypothetical protein
VLLHEDDPHRTNSARHPDRVVPHPLEEVSLETPGHADAPEGDAGAPAGSTDAPATTRLTATLPPISWSMIRLQKTQ